eukprot:4319023-Pyramimonas_sp.AAC.1
MSGAFTARARLLLRSSHALRAPRWSATILPAESTMNYMFPDSNHAKHRARIFERAGASPHSLRTAHFLRARIT